MESRRALAGKIRQRHQERRKFTDSIWWKAASPVRMPASALQRLRRDHLKNLVRSLELLVRTREEQLEGLEKHAKALAELATQKDRLLEDLSTQALRRRQEIAALQDSIEAEAHACESMLHEFANSRSWKLTAPARATASALAWWRRDVSERAEARRAKRRGSCQLEPAHQITVNADGSFTSLGDDPHFNVQHARGSMPRGWVRVSFDVLQADTSLSPVLYTDSDTNFMKAVELRLDSVEAGRACQIVRFPDDTVQVRLDPTDREGRFAIADLCIKPVNKRKVLTTLLRRSPHGRLKTLSEVRRRGLEAVWDEVFAYNNSRKHNQYRSWLEECDKLSDSDLRKIRDHAARLEYKPLISIVMPTYNTRPEFLKAAIDSVIAQIYPHWELCIADDASTKSGIKAILNEYKLKDERIKVVFRETNGHISAASNSALELATGEFTALMDHDDLIPVHALYMVAAELNEHPETDLIYSDEDKVDEGGWRYDPHFKSGWNFEMFCSMNFVNHLGVYRTSLLKKVNGFRIGYEGSQDYDLALRVIAKTTPARIRHIPFVLYHWRVFQTSGSYSTDFLDKAVESSRQALADYFKSIGEQVEITKGYASYNRVIRPVPAPAPLVSLLIPTRDRTDLLRGCVDGLLNRTDYPNLEILILDNESVEPKTQAYFESLAKEKRVKILKFTGPFNFSAINNFGVANALGSIIGMINNDIEVIDPQWLREMVSHAIRPNVGAVGAKLLYADGTLQHGGVILGIGGVAGHSHKHAKGTGTGYFCRIQVPHYLSAVTAACLLMRRECFDEIGGLNEKDLTVAFNDVDLCLRVRKAGYDIVWTPFAELYHLESASRGSDMAPDKAERFAREVTYMRSCWGDILDNDPYYSPNLTTKGEDFAFAFPSRAKKPWLDS
ncbi:GT2 family glycosyltransferase [Skermanella aerolata]|uniref:glycosyltransferase family 2 protein n=1 Tax=Skermanella aerolata TaxID=393310 RepID=UPI003D197F73